MKTETHTQKMILSALMLALGLLLPFFTMQIPEIGNMLLPMHIPVLLCGFICGAPYGLVVGVMVPILRSILFGMPLLFPNAIAMAVELAVYGLVTGLIYARMKKSMLSVYIALVAAMLTGRIAWGIVSIVLYSSLGNVFTWQIFVIQGFANAVPGIILQLILIPLIVRGLQAFGVTYNSQAA